jgi:peptidyl-prolyl cis-trans isomerase SurA
MLVLEVEADELRRRVVEGGEDFAALARRHSRDAATRLEGGRLPGLLNLRQQSAAITAAVEPLKRGGVSQPVRFLVGVGLYQIITLEFTPLDDVRAELSEDLRVRRPSAVEISSFVNQLYLSSKR